MRMFEKVNWVYRRIFPPMLFMAMTMRFMNPGEFIPCFIPATPGQMVH